jgi:hypothetical protein
MVITVEGDRGAGLVKVLGHSHPDRKDLLLFPLTLSRRELYHGPTIDHVSVVDGREPVVILASALIVALIFLLAIPLQAQVVEVIFSIRQSSNLWLPPM